jgi:hypothetical protein
MLASFAPRNDGLHAVLAHVGERHRRAKILAASAGVGHVINPERQSLASRSAWRRRCPFRRGRFRAFSGNAFILGNHSGAVGLGA